MFTEKLLLLGTVWGGSTWDLAAGEHPMGLPGIHSLH